MPVKMCTALDQRYSFFTRRHEDEEAKLLRKTWTFLEKILIYHFYVSTNCESFEGDLGKIANVSIAPSLIQPCWDPQVTFCSYIPYVKIYEVSFGVRNVLIHLLIGNRPEL